MDLYRFRLCAWNDLIEFSFRLYFSISLQFQRRKKIIIEKHAVMHSTQSIVRRWGDDCFYYIIWPLNYFICTHFCFNDVPKQFWLLSTKINGKYVYRYWFYQKWTILTIDISHEAPPQLGYRLPFSPFDSHFHFASETVTTSFINQEINRV